MTGGREEDDLLQACLRVDLDDRARTRISECLAQRLDWDALLRRAEQARLLPLLHWHGRHGVPWPDAVADRLRASYIRNVSLAAVQDARTRRVLEACDCGGVRTILLKGAALRRHLYPDPALRPMTDLDLWVHPGDLDAADAVLRAQGLERRDRGAAWKGWRVGYEAAYLDAGGKLAVELHWSLRQYERYEGVLDLSPERLWAESRRDPADSGTRFLPLRLEGPYLAFHAGAVHGFRGTLWLMDLGEWLARYGPDLDWPRTLSEAEDLGALKAFAWGIRLAEAFRGSLVPPAVARRLDRKLGGERLWAPWMERLLCGSGEYSVPRGFGRLGPLMALDGWGTRARALGRGLMPSAGLRGYRLAARASR